MYIGAMGRYIRRGGTLEFVLISASAFRSSTGLGVLGLGFRGGCPSTRTHGLYIGIYRTRFRVRFMVQGWILKVSHSTFIEGSLCFLVGLFTTSPLGRSKPWQNHVY